MLSKFYFSKLLASVGFELENKESILLLLKVIIHVVKQTCPHEAQWHNGEPVWTPMNFDGAI